MGGGGGGGSEAHTPPPPLSLESKVAGNFMKCIDSLSFFLKLSLGMVVEGVGGGKYITPYHRSENCRKFVPANRRSHNWKLFIKASGGKLKWMSLARSATYNFLKFSDMPLVSKVRHYHCILNVHVQSQVEFRDRGGGSEAHTPPSPPLVGSAGVWTSLQPLLEHFSFWDYEWRISSYYMWWHKYINLYFSWLQEGGPGPHSPLFNVPSSGSHCFAFMFDDQR